MDSYNTRDLHFIYGSDKRFMGNKKKAEKEQKKQIIQKTQENSEVQEAQGKAILQGETGPDTYSSAEKSSHNKWWESTLFVNVIGPVIMVFCAFIFVDYQKNEIEKMNTSINDISKSVNAMQASLTSMQADIKLIDNRLENVENRVTHLENTIYTAASLQLISSDAISITKNSALDEYSLAAPTWKDGDVIAIDVSSGAKLTADQLIDQKLLLPYEQDGQEVVFYGQYNSDYHWDGNCVINAYKDDNLILVTEAFYDDGNLLFYKQILPYVTKGNIDAWNVSMRTTIDGYNTGDSWSYYRTEYKKDFSLDNVSVSDVIYVNDFKDKYCKKLEGFYHGNTSNGVYNDNTGGAYMIKFAKDGTVRTLYSGNFKDGHYNDSTGNAWYITRDEENNTAYMYYKGSFVNDAPTHSKGYIFENNLSSDRIDELLENRLFMVDLKWHQ